MTMNTQHDPYGHQPPPGGGNRGIITALVVVLVIAVVGVGAYLFLGRPKTVSEEQQRQAMEELQPSRGQQSEQNQPQVQPTNQPEARQTGQPPVTPGRGQPSQGTDEGQQDGGAAPSLPQQFAEFTFEKEQGATTKYVSTNDLDIYVTYSDYTTVEELTGKMGNPENIGDWVCEEKGSGKAGTVTCVGVAHQGTVVISGSAADYYLESIAEIGDDLMAVWK